MLTKMAEKQRLDELQEEFESGRRELEPVVLMLAGGPASGKGSSAHEEIHAADLVLDRVSGNAKKVIATLENIKKRGLVPAFILVVRDFTAAAEGNIGRQPDAGRVTPYYIAAEGTLGAMEAALEQGVYDWAEKNIAEEHRKILHNYPGKPKHVPATPLTLAEAKDLLYTEDGKRHTLAELKTLWHDASHAFYQAHKSDVYTDKDAEERENRERRGKQLGDLIYDARIPQAIDGLDVATVGSPDHLRLQREVLPDGVGVGTRADRVHEDAAGLQGVGGGAGQETGRAGSVGDEQGPRERGEVTPEEEPAQKKVSPETLEEEERSPKISEADQKSLAKKGFKIIRQRISGAPYHIRSAKDVMRQVQQATRDAMSDRARPEDKVWYQEAGRAIREYAHGDRDLMEKMVRVTAVLSQTAGVQHNADWVVKAFQQIVAGRTPSVGRYPNKFAESVAPMLDAKEFDADLKGIDVKLQNFYRNLHDEAFEENRWPEAAVIDVHAIGYIWQEATHEKAPGNQYHYAERIMQLAAERYNSLTGENISARQMQSILWGIWKRESARSAGQKPQQGAAWNYPEFWDRASANLTAEVLPSTKLPEGQALANLSYEDKLKYQAEALAAVLDGDGQNELLKAAGVALYKSRTGSGGYEGASTPNTIVGNLVPKRTSPEAKAAAPGELYDYEAVDRLARGWQYIFQQDGVPWFRADTSLDPAALDKVRESREKTARKKGVEPAPTPMVSLGYFLDFDGPISRDQEAEFFELLRKELGDDAGYTNMGDGRIAVVNFRDGNGVPFGLSDQEFSDNLERVYKASGAIEAIPYGAETRYHYHDWEGDPQATEIVREAADRGGPDWTSFVRDRRDKVDAVTAKWVEKAKAQEAAETAPALKSVPVEEAAEPAKITFKSTKDGWGATSHMVMANGERVASITKDQNRYYTQWHLKVDGETVDQFSSLGDAKAGALERFGPKPLKKVSPSEDRLAPNGKPSNLPQHLYDLVRTPEFKNWFGDWEGDPDNASKAVDENGEPMVYKHGTDATEDFDTFDPTKTDATEYVLPRRGESRSKEKLNRFMFTSHDALANLYAGANEGSIRWEEMQAGKTSQFGERPSRVIPVFLNVRNPWNPSKVTLDAKNPYYKTLAKIRNHIDKYFDETPYSHTRDPQGQYNEEDWKDEARRDYQFDLEDGGWKYIERIPGVQQLVRDAGYDGFYTQEGNGFKDLESVGIGVFEPTQIKSIFNRGTFAPEDPAVLKKVEAGEKQTDTPEFKKWFGDSKIVDENGDPLVVYHGTKADIEEFRPTKNYEKDLIFFSKDPKMASDWAVFNASLPGGEKRNYVPVEELKAAEKKYREKYGDALMKASKAEDWVEWDRLRALRPQSETQVRRDTDSVVYPVYLSVQKLFDPRKDYKLIEPLLKTMPTMDGVLEKGLHKAGNWIIYENDDVKAFLRGEGYDGLLMTEEADYAGEKPHNTIAVFSSTQIKSAIGNVGTFSATEPSILKRTKTDESRELSRRLRKPEATEAMFAGIAGGVIHANGEVELNEHEAEVIRRIWAQRAGAAESPFDGVTLTAAQLRGLVKFGRGTARPGATKVGYTDAHLRGFDKLMDTLERAAKTNEGHTVAFVYEEALPHERIHKEERDAGGFTDDQITQLIQTPFTAPAKFQRAYGAASDRNKVSEVAAILGAGEAAEYGLDKVANFEAEKKKFLSTWAQYIADNNEEAIERMGAEAWAKKYAYIATVLAAKINESKTGKSDTGAAGGAGRTGVVPAAGSKEGGEKIGGKEAAAPAEAPAATKPAGESERVSDDAGAGRTKEFSLHYEKVKEQFQDVTPGEEYDPTTVKEQARKAFDFIKENRPRAMRVAYGMEIPPEGVRESAVAIMLAQSLRAAGKFEQAQAVARLASSMFTEAAQELNMAKMDLGEPMRLERTIENERLKQLGKSIKKTDKSELEKGRQVVKEKATSAAKAVEATVKSLTNADALLDMLMGEGSALKKVAPDTPAFEEWFGDSKVVDEDGNPLRVYHGTISNIEEFGTNIIWLTESPKFAAGFADRQAFTERETDEEDYRQADEYDPRVDDVRPVGQNVLPLWATIQNPLDLTALGHASTLREVADYLEDKRLMEALDEETLWDIAGEIATDEERIHPSDTGIPTYRALEAFDVYRDIKKAGYDGVRIMDIAAGGRIPLEAWGAFSPAQVKSAVGNVGTFSAEEGSILKKVDPKYGPELKKAIKAAGGFAKMYDMSSADRRAVFEKVLPTEEATEANALLERAMLSTQRQAISNWIWKNLHAGKTPLYKGVTPQDADALRNNTTMSGLKRMDEATRLAELSKHVPAKLAKQLNDRFEQLKKSGNLASFEERAFGTDEMAKNKRLKGAFARLETMSDLGVLTPPKLEKFMQDYVSDVMGTSVGFDESQELATHTDAVSKALEAVGDDWTADNRKAVVDYFQKRYELEKYISSLTPESTLDVFFGVGARGSMLMAPASLVNSFFYQLIPVATRAVVKRIAGGTQIPGDYSALERIKSTALAKLGPRLKGKAKAHMGMALEIYRKTGYDISRMESLDDGFRYFGERFTHTEGPSAKELKGLRAGLHYLVRGHAKLMMPAMKYLAGGTDTIFANLHRLDTTMMLAKTIATAEERAGTLTGTIEERMEFLYKDAMRPDPQTDEGGYIRESGLMDANHANFTNKDIYSDLAIRIRDAVPKGIGKAILPFAKIPAQATGVGLEMGPIGVMRGLWQVFDALKMEAGVEKQVAISEGIHKSIFSAGGFVVAAIIAGALLDDDDYVGAYDQKARARNGLSTTENAGANMVRIGGNWYSTKWFGPLGIPLSAMMEARLARAKGDSAYMGYVTGMLTGAMQFPGVKEAGEWINALNKASEADNVEQAAKPLKAMPADIGKWALARVATSAVAYDALSMTAPYKYDALGRRVPHKWDSPIKSLFFRANVRTDTSNAITKEFAKLALQKAMPALADPFGKNVNKLKAKLGEGGYTEFLNTQKQRYASRVATLIQSPGYQNAKPERKKEMIDEAREDLIMEPIRERAP